MGDGGRGRGEWGHGWIEPCHWGVSFHGMHTTLCGSWTVKDLLVEDLSPGGTTPLRMLSDIDKTNRNLLVPQAWVEGKRGGEEGMRSQMDRVMP